MFYNLIAFDTEQLYSNNEMIYHFRNYNYPFFRNTHNVLFHSDVFDLNILTFKGILFIKNLIKIKGIEYFYIKTNESLNCYSLVIKKDDYFYWDSINNSISELFHSHDFHHHLHESNQLRIYSTYEVLYTDNITSQIIELHFFKNILNDNYFKLGNITYDYDTNLINSEGRTINKNVIRRGYYKIIKRLCSMFCNITIITLYRHKIQVQFNTIGRPFENRLFYETARRICHNTIDDGSYNRRRVVYDF